MLFNKWYRVFFQRTNGGWCCVKMSDIMLGTYLPKAIKSWVRRHTFKHDCSRPIGQRAINDIGVPRDPTNICSTPVHIVGLTLKHIFKGVSGVNHIAPTSVYHPFWFSRRARSVEDKQRIFTVHHFSWAIVIDFFQLFMPPFIYGIPLYFLLGTLKNQTTVDRWTRVQCFISDFL